MMAMNNPTITIQEFIQSKPLVNVDYQSFAFAERHDDIEFPFLNIITIDYLDDFKDASVEVSVSDNEYKKYRYKPKLLAYDVYDNSELYYIIMAINNKYNIKDFNLTTRKVNLISKSKLYDMLKSIYRAEYKNISGYNRRKVFWSLFS